MINMNRKVFMTSIAAAGLIISLISTSQFAAAPTNDPPGALFFRVEINGETMGGVMKVEGISAEIEALEDKHESGVKLAGETTYSNLVISHALTEDPTLFDWFAESQSGAAKVPVSVIITDNSLVPVAQYDFENAWACKYGLEDLDAAESTTFIIETVEICHEGMDRVL